MELLVSQTQLSAVVSCRRMTHQHLSQEDAQTLLAESYNIHMHMQLVSSYYSMHIITLPLIAASSMTLEL